MFEYLIQRENYQKFLWDFGALELSQWSVPLCPTPSDVTMNIMGRLYKVAENSSLYIIADAYPCACKGLRNKYKHGVHKVIPLFCFNGCKVMFSS